MLQSIHKVKCIFSNVVSVLVLSIKLKSRLLTPNMNYEVLGFYDRTGIMLCQS